MLAVLVWIFVILPFIWLILLRILVGFINFITGK